MIYVANFMAGLAAALISLQLRARLVQPLELFESATWATVFIEFVLSSILVIAAAIAIASMLMGKQQVRTAVAFLLGFFCYQHIALGHSPFAISSSASSGYIYYLSAEYLYLILLTVLLYYVQSKRAST